MDEQKKLDRLLENKTNAENAKFILGLFEPVVKQKHDLALRHLKDYFREGKTENAIFVEHTAKMVAYDDLLNELNHSVKRMAKKELEVLNGNAR